MMNPQIIIRSRICPQRGLLFSSDFFFCEFCPGKAVCEDLSQNTKREGKFPNEIEAQIIETSGSETDKKIFSPPVSQEAQPSPFIDDEPDEEVPF